MQEQTLRRRKGEDDAASADPAGDAPKAKKKEVSKGGWSCCSLLGFLVIVLAIVAGLLALVFVLYLQPRLTFKPLAPVEEIPFQPTEEFKAKLYIDKKPAKIPKMIAKIPLEIKDLSGSSPLGKVPLTDVQSNSVDNVFATFDASSPLIDADYLPVTGSVESLITLEAKDFWEKAQDKNASTLYFYERPTGTDFKAFSQHIPKDIPLIKTSAIAPLFTFSSAGVQTKPRYFLTEEFLTVFEGSIDVILFPPSEHSLVYPYPWYHPNGGSSQVVYQPTISTWKQAYDLLFRYPKFPLIHGYKAKLKAGDVLYIPPMWFWQIKFNRPSFLYTTRVSIYENEVVDALLLLKQPIVDQVDATAFAIKTAIEEIALGLGRDVNEIVRRLVEERYLPLYHDLKVETSTDFSLCNSPDPVREGQTREFLADHTRDAVATFKGLDHLPDVQEIALQIYLEHMTHMALTAEDAFNFFANCFDIGVTNSRSNAQDIE